MCEVLCVTNRKSVNGDFLRQVELVASCRPHAVILREKELSEAEYLALADKVNRICEEHGVKFIAHTFDGAARGTLHLPIADAMRYCGANELGASCHSLDDVLEAERIGCRYVTFGHIFPTKCKDGLAPRGLDALKAICKARKIPVYAIGGIDERNAQSVIEAGASGVCIMSGAMREDAPKLIARLKQI